MTNQDDVPIYDRFSVLLQQEQRYTLPGFCYNDNAYVANKKYRTEMCKWAFDIADYLSLEREIVSLFANYLDRFVSIIVSSKHHHQAFDKKEFKKAVISCCFIAVKNFSAQDGQPFCLYSLQTPFAPEEILRKELVILRSLKWDLNPPTTISFVQLLVQTLGECWVDRMNGSEADSVYDSLLEASRYLSEMAVFDIYLSCCMRQSQVALACVMATLDSIEFDNISLACRKTFVLSVLKLWGSSDIHEDIFQAYEKLTNLKLPAYNHIIQYKKDDEITLSMKDIFTLVRRQTSTHSQAIHVSFSDETRISEGDVSMQFEIYGDDSDIHVNSASRPRAVTEETTHTQVSSTDVSMTLCHSSENSTPPPSDLYGVRYNKSENDFHTFQLISSDHEGCKSHPKLSRHLSFNSDIHR